MTLLDASKSLAGTTPHTWRMDARALPARTLPVDEQCVCAHVQHHKRPCEWRSLSTRTPGCQKHSHAVPPATIGRGQTHNRTADAPRTAAVGSTEKKSQERGSWAVCRSAGLYARHVANYGILSAVSLIDEELAGDAESSRPSQLLLTTPQTRTVGNARVQGNPWPASGVGLLPPHIPWRTHQPQEEGRSCAHTTTQEMHTEEPQPHTTKWQQRQLRSFRHPT
jgi:hypothetical protein